MATKLDSKAITAIAVIVALAAFASPYFTGYATATGCTGIATLVTEPATATVGLPINVMLSGLNGCTVGSRISVRENGCNGPEAAKIRCTTSACTDSATFSEAVPNTYRLVACIDRVGNGRYLQLGEQALSVAKAVDKIDLAVSDLKVPNRVLAGVDFVPTFKISNLGTVTSTYGLYKYGISQGSKQYSGSTPSFTIVDGKSQLIELPSGIYLQQKGKYTLTITVDPYGSYDEVSKANNVAQIEFEVV